MLDATDNDVENDVAAIMDRPISSLELIESLDLQDVEASTIEAEDDGPPQVRVVSGLGRQGTANLQLVGDKLNLQAKEKDKLSPDRIDSLDSMRPSSKIKMFKSKLNLKMSHTNLNQVLPVEYPKPFEILWSHINYKVRTMTRNQGMAGPVKFGWRNILTDISGFVCSGEMTAIMGLSGEGKS